MTILPIHIYSTYLGCIRYVSLVLGLVCVYISSRVLDPPLKIGSSRYLKVLYDLCTLFLCFSYVFSLNEVHSSDDKIA